MPLDPHLAAMLKLMVNSGIPSMDSGTPEQARAGVRAMTCDLVSPEKQIVVGSVTDLEVAGRPARSYRPATASDMVVPTLVFFHGGGFVVGDLDTHDQTCRRLCRDVGVVVLSIDYPLAPEHPFPAAVEHCTRATRWALDHRAELGGADRVAVAGDSAGGNLAAVVSQSLRAEVAAQVLIYPATDSMGEHASRTDNGEGLFLTNSLVSWFGGHYLNGVSGVEAHDPRLAPIRGDLSGLPPALLVTAEFDPLRDEGAAYAEALRAAGVPVDFHEYAGQIHGFLDMGPMSPASEAAVADLMVRVRRLLVPGGGEGTTGGATGGGATA